MIKRILLVILGSLALLTKATPSFAFGAGGGCVRVESTQQIVSTLVSDRQTMTFSDAVNAVNENYSGVLDATNTAFSSFQAEMVQLVDNEGRRISEFRGANVQLGPTFEFKMTGKKSSSAVEILLPSVAAQLYFKKEALFGLVKAECTVNISMPSPMATGDLNVTSGKLSHLDVQAKTKADAQCSTNIPLIGSLLGDVLDHFADKALQPTLAKINAPGGIPLGSENFVGLPKLLKSSTFVVNGQNYGAALAGKLEQFINTESIDLKIHNVNLRPFSVACLEDVGLQASQPMLSLNIPTKNISLNIELTERLNVRHPVSALPAPATASTLGSLTSASTGPLGSLTAQVKNLQLGLDQNFEFAPSIVQLVHSSATATPVVDVSETQDSAIWTGVYLASQCFREAASTDATEKSAAASQIEWALGSVERLFDVTGTSGLLARFTFNPADPNFKNLGISKTASVASGWMKSSKYPGWLWMPGPSRDQYTGILFGLAMCNQLSTSADIKSRTSARVATAVTALEKNGWEVPLSSAKDNSTSNTISPFIQVSWLKLAAITSATPAEQAVWQSKYVSRLNYIRYDPVESLKEDFDPTFINNYEEYYAWNLSYLRFYPLLKYETNSSDLAYFKNRMTAQYWNETHNHGNAEFAFMKVGTMGYADVQDQTDTNTAIASLRELAVRNRRNFAIDNTKNLALGRNSTAGDIGRIIQSYGLGSIGFFSEIASQQAANPIPMTSRAPDVYLWEISPFQLIGGGNGTIESPSVDTIFAYWLGRYHNILSAHD